MGISLILIMWGAKISNYLIANLLKNRLKRKNSSF